ncbi:uncharacterized protein LOC110450226 isoform X3 [Mizuhopecten yessoensis]|uniref:uncharacterized protein LOC110450226 isoform X3 n=1 Tax=Mizuhopecten yessoensis TaxID=6573 RepID=UPI000B45A000|nr:uncharacterized protein LOC110450226 isoform X3 [Mizuhopecten yessoensis]
MLTLMEKSGCRLLEYSNQMHSLQLTGPIPNQRGRFSISNRRIASEVVEGHANIQQPEHDGPKTQNIVRSINRICQTMRPKDPQDLDFEMDRDFLDPLHPNSFCGPSPSTTRDVLPIDWERIHTASDRLQKHRPSASRQFQLVKEAGVWQVIRQRYPDSMTGDVVFTGHRFSRDCENIVDFI